MRKGRFEKAAQKHFSITKLILIIFLLCLLVILLFICCKNTSQQESQLTQSAVVKNPDSIAIPGYEMLELKANNREQTVCLPNPPQNDCYFQISLYLENGTLLWQSELVKPGETSKPMVLSEVLEKGTYSNAVLRYSCYRMDETLSPLNGAETKVTLWMK